MCALVTGVQTCALPISGWSPSPQAGRILLDRNPDPDRDRRRPGGKPSPAAPDRARRRTDGPDAGPDHQNADPLRAADARIEHPPDIVRLGQFDLGRAIPRRSRARRDRSEEHTSELQSLMRISYAVFCLKKKNITQLLIKYI